MTVYIEGLAIVALILAVFAGANVILLRMELGRLARYTTRDLLGLSDRIRNLAGRTPEIAHLHFTREIVSLQPYVEEIVRGIDEEAARQDVAIEQIEAVRASLLGALIESFYLTPSRKPRETKRAWAEAQAQRVLADLEAAGLTYQPPVAEDAA